MLASLSEADDAVQEASHHMSWSEMSGEEPPANRESALAISQLEQIIEQSKAMQHMAEEQIALIRRMDTAARVVKAIQTDVAKVKVRLGVLENRLHPAGYVTDEQQANILNLAPGWPRRSAPIRPSRVCTRLRIEGAEQLPAAPQLVAASPIASFQELFDHHDIHVGLGLLPLWQIDNRRLPGQQVKIVGGVEPFFAATTP